MAFDFSELWQLFQGNAGIAGAGLRAGATIYGGFQQKGAADLAAEGMEIAGTQAVASSHLKALDELKRAKLVASRAQALAAASGAGASDPTVVDIISNIAGEGAYRSELALYEGKEAQRSLQARADAARYQGRAARTAGFVSAASSFGQTFFDKYGGGGPDGGLDTSWSRSPLADYRGFD